MFVDLIVLVVAEGNYRAKRGRESRAWCITLSRTLLTNLRPIFRSENFIARRFALQNVKGEEREEGEKEIEKEKFLLYSLQFF